MTTTAVAQTRKNFPSGPQVMVRGFRSRPYRVVAVSATKTSIQVSGSQKSLGIGYPAGDVFDWDEGLFREIDQESDEGARSHLWAAATRFVPNQLPATRAA